MIFPDADEGQRASALSITLAPDTARSMVAALHGTNVGVYHHLGCGTLGANISIRRLIPTDDQRGRLELLGLRELVHPFPRVSSAQHDESILKLVNIVVRPPSFYDATRRCLQHSVSYTDSQTKSMLKSGHGHCTSGALVLDSSCQQT